MFARIVLAYVIALPFFAGLAASRSGGYEIAVTMASTVPGVLQVFFDTGQGFSEGQSAATFVFAGDETREYRFPLQPGHYRHIRIDPGTVPGRYAVVQAVIRKVDGPTRTVIPPSALTAAYQLTTIERTEHRLVVEATAGGTDPQILYAPPTPLEVPLNERIPSGTLRRLAGLWIVALLVVVLVERLFRPLAARGERALEHLRITAAAHPWSAVVVASFLATVLATYPVLFLGRSLVSPNNGGLRLLYDALPGVPASGDLVAEDTRASDVSAALYAFVPYSNVQREALRLGEWPLWNRYNASGRPLWGQGQTFLLDPLHWVVLMTPDPALGWDLKFVAHRFVFAAGVGLAACAATGAWLPAVIVAFGAPFVGVYGYRVNHPAVFSMTYAPWALFAWFMLARATSGVARARAGLLLVAATSLMLVASPPKEAIGALLGVCTAGSLTVMLSPGVWRERTWNLVAAALAGATAALLTAPHWLVFLDTLGLSATSYDKPYTQVGGLPHAVALVLGPLAPGPVLPGVHALGLVTVLAALTAPSRLLEKRGAFASALVAGAFLAVAFGIVPESWLLRTPFIGNIGHIHDVFITTAVPTILVVSAAGVSVLICAGPARQGVVAVLMLIAVWWIVQRVAELAPQNGFEPWAACFVLVLAAMVPGCWGRRGRVTVLSVVAAAAAVCLLVLPGGLHASSPIATLDALLVQPRFRVPLDSNSPAVDSLHEAATEPTRVVGTEWTLLSGSQALYEIEGIGGPDALFARNYEELVNAAGIWRSGWLTRVGVHDVVRLASLMDILNVGFLLTAPDLVPPDFADVKVTGRDKLRIGRRVTAWPRAFFVDGVTAYHDTTDLLRQVAAHGRPFAAIDPGDRTAIEATRELMKPTPMVVSARGYRLTVNSTAFRVRATGPGVAVLSETYLPSDFRATLNGRRVSYFRVNHAFKGVVIPSAGDWEVAFEYRPARWNASWMLAGCGALGLAALGRAARASRYASR